MPITNVPKKLKTPRPRSEGERPGGIRLTEKVVWARARLWHRDTIHIIVFTADWGWRVCCNGQPVDDAFDIWPHFPANCEGCERTISWQGGVRRASFDGSFWAY